ncbi:MAG: shikimate kinase [Gracilimonas sp.]
MIRKKIENKEERVFICGFMASGKSTLGKALAKKLDREFIDLDKIIEKREGMYIKQIFNKIGEAYFREKEWEYLLDLTRNFKGVVALGGGALQNQRVVDHLKIHGLLIFLDTPMEEVVERVFASEERPILFDEAGKIKSKESLFKELKTLYSGREEFYKQAQITIKTPLFTTVQEMAEAAKDKITRHV